MRAGNVSEKTGNTGGTAPVLPPARPGLRVWDTHDVPCRQVFEIYREVISRVYLPWSPERDRSVAFEARVETLQVRAGSITRHRCSPHVAVRSGTNIADSDGECCYLLRVLSGRMECRRQGSVATAGPGDILLFDSVVPTRLTMGPEPIDALVVTIPRSDLPTVIGADADLSILLDRSRSPLSKCMALMAELSPFASAGENVALYDAARSLLPLESMRCNRERNGATDCANMHYLLQAIIDHIDENIENVDLSPERIAEQFGISVRYVHKLFIGCGMTFRSYATARRLDYVCKDLVSPASRRQPISVVAFRWGFNDLSSFNRAFKSRFGCTPSEFRIKAGNDRRPREAEPQP